MLHPTLPGGATMSRPFGPYEQFIVIYILVLFLYTPARAADERVHMSHLQHSECILNLPRATPGAIQIAGLSGRRKMYKLMWDNDKYVTVVRADPR